ncbi:putative RNA-directed DNA polymerase [Tanacetum coccineum]
MRLMLFLMGLKDTYGVVKSQILTTKPLSDVKSAFATLPMVESHKNNLVHSSFTRPSSYVFASRSNTWKRNPGSSNVSNSASSSSVKPNQSARSPLPFTSDQIQRLMALIGLKPDSVNEFDEPYDDKRYSRKGDSDDIGKSPECANIFTDTSPTATSHPEDVFTESLNKHSNTNPDGLGSSGASPKGDDATLYDDDYESEVKYKSNGEVKRFKARLVAKGYSLKEGIDYEENFSHVVKIVIVRCLLTITFHDGHFSEKEKSKSDFSLYTMSKDDTFIVLLVYVDDIIRTGNNETEINKFKEFLSLKFNIKDLGKVKYFLRIEVLETCDGLCLNKRKYCLELLSEYGMLACKPLKAPIPDQSKKKKDKVVLEIDSVLSNITCYQKIVGKLISLPMTRPDIAYAVHCIITRGTGISFKHETNLSLSAYVDSDWAKCKITQKSMTSFGGLYGYESCFMENSAIQMAANPVFHERTKHFETNLYFLKEKVSAYLIKTFKIKSEENVADFFTKVESCNLYFFESLKRLSTFEVELVEYEDDDEELVTLSKERIKFHVSPEENLNSNRYADQPVLPGTFLRARAVRLMSMID